MRHLHDGLFGSGEIVAQIDQRRADIAELALARAHDVGKLGNGGGGVICIQVLAGITQVDHDAGEVRQMLRGHAQLATRSHDLVDLIRPCRNFCRHSLGRIRQLVKLSLRCIYGFAHRGKGGLKVDGRLDRRRAQRSNRRGQGGGEQLACLDQILPGGIAGFPEGFHAFSGLRPFGLSGFQLFIAVRNVSLRLLYSGTGVVECDFRILHRVGGLTDFVRIVDLLCRLQLFLCSGQRLFVFCDGFLLKAHLFLKQRQLCG